MKVLIRFIVLILLSAKCFGTLLQDNAELDQNLSSTNIRKSAQACKNFGNQSMKVSLRIVGGTFADVDEFPHFASIGKKNKEDESIAFRCGGSLVSEKYVLTAAHCKEICSDLTRCVVRLGTNTLKATSKDYSGVDFNVAKFTNFKKYNGRTKANDIALVELEENVPFQYNMWPACLVQENPVENIELMIAGFGRTSVENSLIKSNDLLKAQLEEIPLEECRYNYTFHQVSSLEHNINDTLLCAKNREKHQDACDGDSGSGLVLLSNETYYVVGVSSFGLSCNTSLPAFYTRVWMYLDWIEKIVWPNL